FRVGRAFVLIGLVSGCGEVPSRSPSADPPVPNRPKVPGLLRLALRDRPSGKPKVSQVDWKASETAIIVIDMWDDIYCKQSAQRIGVLAPKMNAVLSAAREHGVQIIHAPSGTVDLYADTPFRKRMQQAKPAKPPFDISS